MNLQLTPMPQMKQQQKLIIGHRLKRQLELLYMSQQEVQDLAYEALMSNPLLEMEHCGPEEEGMFSSVELDPDKEERRQQEFDDQAQDFGDEMNLSVYEYNRNKNKSTHDWGDDLWKEQMVIPAKGPTLRDELLQQLSVFELDSHQKEICIYIIDNLDGRGYFPLSIEEFCSIHMFQPDEAAQMLQVIQMLEPVGIGARDLKECILLQLQAAGYLNVYTIRIINEHLDLLAQNNIPTIAKKLKLSVKETQKYCDRIREMSPIPTCGYDTGENIQYVVPDAAVSVGKSGEILIQMNRSVIPRLTLNQEYCHMLQELQDKEVVSYLKKNRTAAEDLICDINMRQSTLLKVIQYVVEHQIRYFEDGRTLQPMTMANVADGIGMHVSTVSRAINEKYIMCAAGTVSLRSLFAAGYEKRTSGQTVSNVVMKQRMKEMVAGEDKSHPLTDDMIRTKFEEMGLKISRRTVSKYRDELGIPSSAMRKYYQE